MSTIVNSANLIPIESKSLPSRAPTGEQIVIVDSLKQLYTCRPTEKAYEMYASEAVFHDPISYAKGLPLIKSLFNGLAKIFQKATIDKFVLLQTPIKSNLPTNTILIDQDVTYHRQVDSPTKTINSLLTIELDQKTGKIIRHTEEWNHEKETQQGDGFFGALNQWRKEVTTEITGMVVEPEAS